MTDEHRISQPGAAAEQEAKSSSGPVEVEGEVTECSTDFLDTHSHVPGVDTQPGLRINVPEHVSSDPSPDFDGACQLEPQRGSPKFIMPLAPLGNGSTLFCQTSAGLKGDQTCVKRSLDVNRDLGCEQPSDLWPTSGGITGEPPVEGDEELIHKKENTTDSSEDPSSEGHRDLDPAGCFAPTKTLAEEINDLSRELSNLAVVPADHFSISEENRVAIITLDLNDPFASKPAKPNSAQSARTQEKMPHKSHKSTSEGKKHLKKDKSAGHHHGAPAAKKQESFSQNVSAQQVCKHEDARPLTGENHANENAPARLEDKETKLVIETGVATEKAPSKSHGKKKKKHAQNTTGVKTVGEPLVEVENGAKPKTARGRIDMFEEKLGAKAGKAQKDSEQSQHAAEKKSQQTDAKAPLEEQPPRHTDHKDQQVKHFPSPLKDDVKRPRLSGDKFGKILSAMESKLPKADVSIKAKGEERKADAGATPKKAYSEVVKQKVPPKEGKE